jgi:hypothetical protein
VPPGRDHYRAAHRRNDDPADDWRTTYAACSVGTRRAIHDGVRFRNGEYHQQRYDCIFHLDAPWKKFPTREILSRDSQNYKRGIITVYFALNNREANGVRAQTGRPKIGRSVCRHAGRAGNLAAFWWLQRAVGEVLGHLVSSAQVVLMENPYLLDNAKDAQSFL